MFDKAFWLGLVDFKDAGAYPNLPCPYCRSNGLAINLEHLSFRNIPRLSINNTLTKSLEAKSRRVDSLIKENKFFGILLGLAEFAEELYYTNTKFTGFIQCNSCGGEVAVVGTAKVPNSKAPDGVQHKLKAEYFSPSIPMFDPPAETPIGVLNEVIQAFNHFHSDPVASGGKLRRALEQVCRELGFDKGSLNNSIQEMRKIYPKEAEWLMPLKMVGNEAVHAEGVDEEDLARSFVVLEQVLDIFRRRAREAEIEKEIPRLTEKFQRSGKHN